MSVPPESIEVGKCYLLERLRVSRVCLVTDLMAGSSVRFEWRDASGSGGVFIWTTGATDLRTFASEVLREVPCEWTPEKRKGWW
jgi:hypothetical protein